MKVRKSMPLFFAGMTARLQPIKITEIYLEKEEQNEKVSIFLGGNGTGGDYAFGGVCSTDAVFSKGSTGDVIPTTPGLCCCSRVTPASAAN